MLEPCLRFQIQLEQLDGGGAAYLDALFVRENWWPQSLPMSPPKLLKLMDDARAKNDGYRSC